MKKKITMVVLCMMLFVCNSSFAFATDSVFTIISPAITSSSSITYSNNLLISIKVLQGQNLQISLYYYPEASKTNSGALGATETLVSGPHYFSSNQQLNFFTTQVNDIKYGLYALKIDTVDSAGLVLASEKEYFMTKGKQDEASETKLYEAEPKNTLQIFQNLFKNIFGN